MDFCHNYVSFEFFEVKKGRKHCNLRAFAAVTGK